MTDENGRFTTLDPGTLVFLQLKNDHGPDIYVILSAPNYTNVAYSVFWVNCNRVIPIYHGSLYANLIKENLKRKNLPKNKVVYCHSP